MKKILYYVFLKVLVVTEYVLKNKGGSFYKIQSDLALTLTTPHKVKPMIPSYVSK